MFKRLMLIQGGEKAIRQQLYDAHKPEDGLYPKSIRLWHNFSAMDDFVAHDEDLADNFKEMVRQNYLSDIVEHFIYTFYMGGGCWSVCILRHSAEVKEKKEDGFFILNRRIQVC